MIFVEDSVCKKDGEIGNSSPENAVKLTDAQRAKIERNRQKALLIKQARQNERSFTQAKSDP